MATYLLNRPNKPEHLNLHQQVCENLTAHKRSSQIFMMIVMFVVVMMKIMMIMITKLKIYAI
jgi:hypothetical protein